MTVRTTFAAAVFAVLAGAAGAALAASAPCAPQMGQWYAELGRSMKLEGAAKTAYDKYVAARQAIADKHCAWARDRFDKRPETREEAMKMRAEGLKNRAAMIEEIAKARAELNKSLTAEQKATLDNYEPGVGARGMGPGPRGHGRHHGRGCGMGPGMGYGPGMGPGCGMGYGPGMGPGCAGGPGCVYGTGPRGGDGWGWHGPRHSYGHPGYGYGPGCRW